MKRHILKFVLLITLLHSGQPVESQSVLTFGQVEVGGGFNGPDQVQGWEFVPQTDVTVLQLGLYDGRSGGGFNEAHQVAIWDANGNMITSAIIPQGQSGVLKDQFRFVDIPSTPLSFGQNYVIGAFMPAPDSDYTLDFTPQEAVGNGVAFDLRIQFVAYRFGFSPGGISFPQSRFVDDVGGFGPNFVIAVPEPSTFILLTLMLPVSALWALRRHRVLRATQNEN